MNSVDTMPAPYGHSCEECVRSKCKCMLRAEGGQCQKCYRLNRTCRPTTSQRRQHSSKKNMPRSISRNETIDRTVQLEQKVDELVSILKTNGTPRSTSSPASESTTASIFETAVRDAFESSASEAEDCLSAFKTQHVKYLPFVHIPNQITARELASQRPFLCLCIMAIASKSISKQRLLNFRIRRILAEEMVIKSEKSIDLLLGILVFLAWYVDPGSSDRLDNFELKDLA